MLEQRINVKVYVKLGNGSRETLGLLRTAHDEVTMKKSAV